VEELLAERGVQVSYEAVRLWCLKFGPTLGAGLRRRRRRAADTWHLDEVQLKIRGKRHWLWRAVDRDGLVLDMLVQERRNREAAERFLRRVLEGEGVAPRVVVTDKLASYPSALKRVLPQAEHRRHKGWLFRELCGECRCRGLAELLAGPCRCCHTPLSPASRPSRSTPSEWKARTSALKRPVPPAARPVHVAGCSVARCTATTSAAHATCRGGGVPRA
jgi:DDE domain